MNGKKTLRKTPVIPAAVLLALAIGFFWYVGVYYHADAAALAALEGTDAVTVSPEKDSWLFDGPGDAAALVFYPGAKVAPEAYAPLMQEIAAQGTDCILVKMPFNLAVLDIGRAGKVMAGYDYGSWYIGGHSLGGAMAADYAAKHPEGLDGLVLLAAYPTKPLPADGLAVLSLWGSEDGVLRRDKLTAGEALMPAGCILIEIEGGNHAWFGAYGEQKGDGTAALSHREQWAVTANAVTALTLGH